LPFFFVHENIVIDSAGIHIENQLPVVFKDRIAVELALWNGFHGGKWPVYLSGTTEYP